MTTNHERWWKSLLQTIHNISAHMRVAHVAGSRAMPRSLYCVIDSMQKQILSMGVEQHALAVLQDARRRGNVAIVTASRPGWLEIIAHTFMPKVAVELGLRPFAFAEKVRYTGKVSSTHTILLNDNSWYQQTTAYVVTYSKKDPKNSVDNSVAGHNESAILDCGGSSCGTDPPCRSSRDHPSIRIDGEISPQTSKDSSDISRDECFTILVCDERTPSSEGSPKNWLEISEADVGSGVAKIEQSGNSDPLPEEETSSTMGDAKQVIGKEIAGSNSVLCSTMLCSNSTTVMERSVADGANESTLRRRRINDNDTLLGEPASD